MIDKSEISTPGKKAAMNFTLEKARSEHIDYLNTMIPRSVRALSAGFYTPAQIDGGITEIFGVDTQLVADGTYYVAEGEEGILGCGGWSRRRTLYGGDQLKDDADPLLDPTREAARIRAFFVDPAYARQGIGTGLMNHCEAAARQAGFSAMELVATLPGEQLYQHFGYNVLKRYDHVLSNGLPFPVVLMRKSLQQ